VQLGIAPVRSNARIFGGTAGGTEPVWQSIFFPRGRFRSRASVSQIYARQGIDLDRSTLADWVGAAAQLLQPLVAALARYTMAGCKLHGDDTPMPVLDPGRGRTKTGRMWTYVRDDRPAGSGEPPAVIFYYAPDRKGERPWAHLASFEKWAAGTQELPRRKRGIWANDSSEGCPPLGGLDSE